MSTATEKNQQALTALFRSSALAHRLAQVRIGVRTGEVDLPRSASLLARTLSDMLGRLWVNLDFAGSVAPEMLQVAHQAAESGGLATSGMAARWKPPYDVVVTIECDSQEEGSSIRVGADDWTAELGPTARCGDSGNPVGPAFAAAVAAAQVFHRIFSASLEDSRAYPFDTCSFDVREVLGTPQLRAAPVHLGETHIFGAGAVSHGLLWLLENWPHQVTGALHLVDHDPLGRSNGQRYAFMRAQDIGRNKVDVARERLMAAHPGLQVESHALDLNAYCASRGYDLPLERVVAGLDSAEARRQTALKLPTHCINMWTSGDRVGAGRYTPGQGRACLACGYLEQRSQIDEVAEVHGKLQLPPAAIRNLLDSGRGLTESEAAIVAGRTSLDAAWLAGQPLRSVLPAACATSQLTFGSQREVTDVPFSFASMLAGIAGFVMLLANCQAETQQSCEWSQHLFKRPNPRTAVDAHQHADCLCCRLLVGD